MNDDDDVQVDGHAKDAGTDALYARACAAYCRGHLALDGSLEDTLAIERGREQGLRLHRFKRTQLLPRVLRVISTLRALVPASLLDVGTGRGVLLWPLLEAFESIPVTCLDVRADRVADLQATSRGGLPQLRAVHGSIEDTGVDAIAADVAIAAEVLEHVADENKAARALVRAARRFVLVTVPSQPDHNPQHLRLFTASTLRSLFVDAGAAKVVVDGVRGHLFAVVTTGKQR